MAIEFAYDEQIGFSLEKWADIAYSRKYWSLPLEGDEEPASDAVLLTVWMMTTEGHYRIHSALRLETLAVALTLYNQRKENIYAGELSEALARWLNV